MWSRNRGEGGQSLFAQHHGQAVCCDRGQTALGSMTQLLCHRVIIIAYASPENFRTSPALVAGFLKYKINYLRQGVFGAFREGSNPKKHFP